MGARVSTTGSTFLRGLPAIERASLQPHLEPFAMGLDDVLCEAGAPIVHAIFPRSGLISLLARTAEESVVHGGFVGREGLFGLALAAGMPASTVEARVQGAGSAVRIEARRFQGLLPRCPVFARRCQRSAVVLLDQVTQIAACNGFHSIEARTARWILLTGDRLGSRDFTLRQSSLANMLGVLRPSISQVAGRFSRDGLVEYRRGEMRILDRPGLSARACSCYPVAADAYLASLS